MAHGPYIMHSRLKTSAAPRSPAGIRSDRPRLRSAALAAVLGTILIMLPGARAAAEDAAKDQRQWWIDHYGLVDARTEPLMARAEEVFRRVAAAADKKGNRPPKLVVIGGKGDPYALTLRDGSVVLTRESLRICYRGAAPETGDSRLAFLIGHELAHLAKDDFWHSSAFEAVSNITDSGDVRKVLASQLEKTGGSLDFVKTQELQADSYGIISMTMAGYDPKTIIGPDGQNFFAYWDSQIADGLPYSEAAHLSPEARAEFVRTELRPVIEALDRFDQGVQLYQRGAYREAASRFESFIEKYPGREVYSNLGLTHYQLAVRFLSACSGVEPGFRLPTALDPATTARRLQQTAVNGDTAYVQNGAARGSQQDAGRLFEESEQQVKAECLQDPSYQADLQEAIRFLEAAEKKDVAYLPARVNLSSALILAGNYAKASSVASEALQIDPAHAEAAGNKAVAEYLFGKKNIAENPTALALPNREQNSAPKVYDVFALGLTADLFNESAGPFLTWWPFRRAGLQASYGQGTFTTAALSGLVRFDKIAGLTPYAGLGYLSVARDKEVLGATERFSGRGGELIAGAALPLSARFSLMTDVHANTIKLEKTVTRNGQSVPVEMTFNPISLTVTIVYAVY